MSPLTGSTSVYAGCTPYAHAQSVRVPCALVGCLPCLVDRVKGVVGWPCFSGSEAYPDAPALSRRGGDFGAAAIARGREIPSERPYQIIERKINVAQDGVTVLRCDGSAE